MTEGTSPFEPNSEYDIMFKALHGCAADWQMDIYEYMEKQPQTSFICFLVEKLNEMGYNIKKQ